MTNIIAEVGVNFFGDIHYAISMIELAKEAGANSVKFQMFNSVNIKDYPLELMKKLTPMILNDGQVSILCKAAHSLGLNFIVSVMYPEAFDTLKTLSEEPDFIKIRCADNQNEEIALPAVDFCLTHKTGLIVSMEKPPNEYDRYTLYKLPSYLNRNVVFMYCVPSYPPELSEINLSLSNTKHFSGYSNHYPSKYIPMLAISRGLNFIEIHVKKKVHAIVGFKAKYGYWKPIDDAISLTFEELEDVCQFRDTIQKCKFGV